MRNLKKLPWENTSFIAAYDTAERIPASQLPQIPILGRSNVGKSSLINHITRNKHLSKVSSRPGKTQTINFFEVDSSIHLVDLPGYGYAKIAKEKQAAFSEQIDLYFQNSDQICLALLLLDSRHEMTCQDKECIAWLKSKNVPLLFVFTKFDQILPSKRTHRLKELEISLQQELEAGTFYFAPFSIKDPSSRKQLTDLISTILGENP